MTRAAGNKRTAVQKKSNAIGFSRRQARKKARQSTSIDDVYEFQPGKVRRSKVALCLTKEEHAEFGRDNASDSEGDNHRDGQPQPRLIGQNSDDEGVGSEDDEDIESDAAFGESDQDTFAGYGFTRKGQPFKKPKRKSSVVKTVHFEVNLDESDKGELGDDPSGTGGSESEVEEEGEPDEFFDILDILDGRADPLSDEELSAASSRENEVSHAVSDEEEEEQGVDDDEDHDMDPELADQFTPSDDEEDVNALHNLGEYISNLDPSAKRKTSEDEGVAVAEDDAPRKKRKLLKERSEAGAENEFAASGQSKLNFEDLLAPLAGQSDNMDSLKKSTKVLTSSKNKALSAPLPQRTQDRLDREAAYEQTKREVDQWQATMKQIKEAEHLSFPLQAPAKSITSNSELIAKFKPTTELETSIDKLLKKANFLDSQRGQGPGSLPANPLTAEVVIARTSEVRKMRELMFRADTKAKRLAKIKSKTYRRLKKKQKQKLMERLDEEDSANDEQKRLQREVERARERATLKHKNTGKWAKAMKARGELDEDQRQEVLEMLQRGEELRRKIHAKSEGDEGEDDDDSGGDAGDEGRVRASAFNEVARIVEEESLEHSNKSLFNMKFMKDAMARDNKKVQDMADEFLTALASSDAEVAPGNDDDDSQNRPERTSGRFSFRPGTQMQPTSLRQSPPGVAGDAESMSAISSHTLSSQSTAIPPTKSKPPTTVTLASSNTALPVVSSEPENLWLNIQSSSSKITRKNEIIVGKSSGLAEKSKNRLRKQQEKHESEREKARNDAVVEISMNTVLNLRPEETDHADPPPVYKAKVAAQLGVGSDEDSGVNSEVEEQERRLAEKKRKGRGKAKDQGIARPFAQRDLVSLAFAGDKVVQDFQEVKQREILEDAPKEADTTLPGWGSWSGTGTRKAPPKPFLVKKVAGVDPRSREDYGKAHVIISEKRDKKAAKYMVKDLPYPYTSKAQYERSLQTPIGTEWNTRLGFQRGTLPRVVKKPGIVIEPLVKMS
ncbi:Utp14-domain-containing protein [Thelephora ganbajun]|uniref:Utp14-domain-containing protein n=1 Tax=Thelephora ganbajun TaxID=370292 RepID=A0ACB6ZKL3_THEGA|nr:Utp14-domain-containing protein [Thelephora ganbajun]